MSFKVFELETYNIAQLDKHLASLLFQTGYLTMTREVDTETFLLNYPNKEVQDSYDYFRDAKSTDDADIEGLKYVL